MTTIILKLFKNKAKIVNTLKSYSYVLNATTNINSCNKNLYTTEDKRLNGLYKIDNLIYYARLFGYEFIVLNDSLMTTTEKHNSQQGDFMPEKIRHI